MKVYLDDERETPSGWTRAYWPEEVIELLKSNTVTDLSLDHDLGDDTTRNGYLVIQWIEEETATNPNYDPPAVITVHSANPSARIKMIAGINSIRRFVNQR